jgi:hypothetical protein
MAEKIPINLKTGYRPHFVPAFLERYGVDSMFVRAAADCLTARHVKVLIKAQRISPNIQPLQLGIADATKSIETLLKKMAAGGTEKPVLYLLWESMGVKPPGILEAEVDRLFGAGAFTRWLTLFELRKFDEAANLCL